MDKSCILLTLSIKTALFMDKSCILLTLSTKTALFMDNRYSSYQARPLTVIMLANL